VGTATVVEVPVGAVGPGVELLQLAHAVSAMAIRN
jgi:hypothetical protein